MNKKKIKIIFIGTSKFSAYHLKGLINSIHKISCIITKPDTRANRGHKLIFNPIKKLALKYRIDILQPESLSSLSLIKQIKNYKCDIIIVVDYGLLIPNPILNIPKLFCMNVHASLLPRWRGAAPIQRALLANDLKTGISIIKMNNFLDQGDIIYQIEYNILLYDTYGSLYKKLAILGLQGVLFILNKIAKGTKIKFKSQNINIIKPTYAEKISKKECKLDWLLPAKKLECMIRAFNPYPGTYFFVKDKRFKVWQAEVIANFNNNYINKTPGTILSINRYGIQINTINGILNIQIIQPSGKKQMNIQNFLNFNQYKNLFIKNDIII
ncbi:methionyl-tRNA formyltransferase [Enterobacteriaceae endosymbiont of Donacia cincticornis]|uniref:methionyl-tRNA formyltransferase n=1 Tax=Enterobacteriaceae endosymbiont of Donacia cincticornis TaxID=2675773 RepID=UPI00144A2C88|nr:methionyl-tRNA formyltransferase [Enterobacteriaceae endosymbiont of Donacia cincticornis]QJC36130.1 methionyl-tRNA formyltransferase [Enterobacteriaceae endosymbiont of Donacia cincticornis]